MDSMTGWTITAQGYVRGSWRLYEARTWCVGVTGPDGIGRMVMNMLPSVEAAAAFVDAIVACDVLAEREACAKVAEESGPTIHLPSLGDDDDGSTARRHAAAAIRSRK